MSQVEAAEELQELLCFIRHKPDLIHIALRHVRGELILRQQEQKARKSHLRVV